MSGPSSLRFPGWLWLIALAGLLLSLASAQQARRDAEAETLQRLAFSADQVALRVEERLAAYALILRGASALFDASETVDRGEWRTFARQLQASALLSNIEGIGFARHVPAEARAAYREAMRAEGFGDYAITPAGQREAYGPVHFIEPFAGRNRRALGYDMFAEPTRHAAMARARDTGQATLSGRVTLVTEQGEPQPATLLYLPVYRRDLPQESVAERRAALLGWVYMPFRMHDLMAGILAGRDWSDGEPLTLHLHEVAGDTRGERLYASDPEPVPASDFRQARDIQAAGQTWRLTLRHRSPSTAADLTAAGWRLAGGLALTFLLCALLASLLGTRARALSMSQALTRTIRQREAQLEKAVERLRTIAARIPGVVYEYRLMPGGRSCFPYASEGMRQVYGVAPERVREDATPVFTTIHPEDRDAVAVSIARSAETLAPWRQEYRVQLPDGQAKWLFGDALPHAEADGAVSWYGVITDITERKRAEAALHAAHLETRRFREALDHVGSYIYMKDREHRYTYANRATLELFGCDAEALVGCEDADFFSSDTVAHLHALDRRVLAGEQTTEEVVTRDAEGARRVYLEIKTPIRDGEAIVGLLGISSDITLIKEHERQLEYLAHYDALTGLPNRVLLADRLGQAMAHEQRLGRRLAVVYLDLDGFKSINDRFGHAAGDHLLVSLAQRLREVIREGDTLSRLGGDEFVAVLVDLTDPRLVEPLLRRLLEVAAQPVWYEGQRLAVGASLGVTFYPQAEGIEADQLLRQADQAMYQAKLAGKGRYHLFDPEHDRSVRSHHESLERLQQALAREEFVLHYQPKVNLRSGEVIGVEALVRWQHPERGLLPPGEFLPVIEEHALTEALGEWVIRRALAQAAAWRREGLGLPVSVNMAARHLRQREFPERLAALLVEQPDLPAGSLELEILETSALGDLAQVTELLEACRRLGVQVSLDDFGTGYSSLTYLKRLPAGTVKIDQSFVRDLLDAPEDLKILAGVLGLAEAFERQVIAEGVETLEHGQLLLRLGCELGQGYGIARPMPAAEVPGWCAGWHPPAVWAGQAPLAPSRLPLLTAEVEHRAWCRQLHHALAAGSGVAALPLARPHCRFCDWLALDHGDALPDLGRLRALHREAHALVARLIEEGAGDAAEAHRTLDEACAVLLAEIERLLTP
ncbi:diguanylate cyclase/phosphodiesterase with PAS/PAC sensor(s) [Halomonas shengliensis]|uniref:Diguanylate cyclase/phosphodiesterase with PAS/PAC sensor(S) n=1 Tax=Halomonas shengliensis TaxID=419597 RepID=A0A1H0MHL1_9GAMM|nr:EAL domain-containing protein [Halomonas shengliensis]SDO79630.1 diguanylate cyclase/phosphodiesterase with PAS/PAC sensor(s) [Halomonas shengliensis]